MPSEAPGGRAYRRSSSLGGVLDLLLAGRARKYSPQQPTKAIPPASRSAIDVNPLVFKISPYNSLARHVTHVALERGPRPGISPRLLWAPPGQPAKLLPRRLSGPGRPARPLGSSVWILRPRLTALSLRAGNGVVNATAPANANTPSLVGTSLTPELRGARRIGVSRRLTRSVSRHLPGWR